MQKNIFFMLLISSTALLQAAVALDRSALTTKVHAIEGQLDSFLKKTDLPKSYDDTQVKTQVTTLASQLDRAMQSLSNYATVAALTTLQQKVDNFATPAKYDDSGIQARVAALDEAIKSYVPRSDFGEFVETLKQRDAELTTFTKERVAQLSDNMKTFVTGEKLDAMLKDLSVATTPYDDTAVKTRIAELREEIAAITTILTEPAPGHDESATSTSLVLKSFVEKAQFEAFQKHITELSQVTYEELQRSIEELGSMVCQHNEDFDPEKPESGSILQQLEALRCDLYTHMNECNNSAPEVKVAVDLASITELTTRLTTLEETMKVLREQATAAAETQKKQTEQTLKEQQAKRAHYQTWRNRILLGSAIAGVIWYNTEPGHQIITSAVKAMMKGLGFGAKPAIPLNVPGVAQAALPTVPKPTLNLPVQPELELPAIGSEIPSFSDALGATPLLPTE